MTNSTETVGPPCDVSLSVPANGSLVAAHALCAQVTTRASFPAASQAQASTAGVTVGAPTVPAIAIGAVQSTSATNCFASFGTTTIASLKIGTTTIIASPTSIKPNTTINLGLIKVVLNEQAPLTGPDHGLVVNAIHITSPGSGTPSLLNLVVASSTSDIGNCTSAP